MHLLSAIWVVSSNTIPNSLPPDAGKKFDAFAKIAVPLLVALVPTAVAAFFKWLQDHGQQKRKADLVEQLTKLAKNIAELPAAGGDTGVRMRAALDAELEAGLRELASLQAHTPRRAAGVAAVGVAALVPGIKSLFLWWRPRGFRAWMLHLAFYASLVLLAFMTIGFSAVQADKAEAAKAEKARVAALHEPGQAAPVQSAPVQAASAAQVQTQTETEATSPGVVITIYLIFGLPPLILRYYAVKIHRQQCAADEAAPVVAPSGAAPNMQANFTS